MKKSKQVTRKGYETYVKQYQAKVASISKRGATTENVGEMLSFNEWKYTYKAVRNTLSEEVNLGNRKAIGNVNQYIVQKQVYAYSGKQARAIKIAAEKSGQNLSTVQIRTGAFDWSDIQEYYDDLRASGVTGKEAKHMVSQYYFLSP